ncbi:16352_t:CDS:2, partial [Racocetra persica]
NITDKKLQLPNLLSVLETAINLSYLKKAASKHEEFEECTDNYIVESCIKKVIKGKRRNSVREAQKFSTPEKCDDIMSNQKDLLKLKTALTTGYLNITAPHYKKQWEDKHNKA